MNASDARIAAIYTAQPGATVKDTSPNAGQVQSNRFDLILQLEAGRTLATTGGKYTVHLTAINENTGLPQAGLVPVTNPFVEDFDGVIPGSPVPPGTKWLANGTDYVRTGTNEPLGILRFNLTIPAGLTGRFHYNVEFFTNNHEVADLAQSDPFILL